MEQIKRVGFDVDPELVRLVTLLRKFYLVSTNNKILPLLIFFNATDIAHLPESPGWTASQKTAWLECKRIVADTAETFVRHDVKKILKEEIAAIEFSPEELAQLPREKLAAYASARGVAVAGLRKSGILRELKNVGTCKKTD